MFKFYFVCVFIQFVFLEMFVWQHITDELQSYKSIVDALTEQAENLGEQVSCTSHDSTGKYV